MTAMCASLPLRPNTSYGWEETRHLVSGSKDVVTRLDTCQGYMESNFCHHTICSYLCRPIITIKKIEYNRTISLATGNFENWCSFKPEVKVKQLFVHQANFVRPWSIQKCVEWRQIVHTVFQLEVSPSLWNKNPLL